MSRGHGASRRRNYGRRQSEIRHRGADDMPIDLQGPDAWPRGTGWDSASTRGVALPHGAALSRESNTAHGNGAAR